MQPTHKSNTESRVANTAKNPIMALEAIGMFNIKNTEPNIAQMKPRREAKTLGALSIILLLVPSNFIIVDDKKHKGLY